MADPAKIGRDWDADELDAIVADHFAMLAADQAGQAFVKSHRAQALMDRIGRTHRSVEFKHMNISAVLTTLGLPTIRGYKPKFNIQQAIYGAVERYLDAHLDWLAPTLPIPLIPAQAGTQAFSLPGVAEAAILYEEPPPPFTPAPPLPPALERLVRKWDPVQRDFRNRALGAAGEEIVYRSEHARLRAADRPDLARKVRWVAQEDGDGAGYDIRSFDAASGDERWLEVKTTRGARTTPFFLTRNELAVASAAPELFRLYRLYDFTQTRDAPPKLFTLAPPLEGAVTLEPETWRAGFG